MRVTGTRKAVHRAGRTRKSVARMARISADGGCLEVCGQDVWVNGSAGEQLREAKGS